LLASEGPNEGPTTGGLGFDVIAESGNKSALWRALALTLAVGVVSVFSCSGSALAASEPSIDSVSVTGITEHDATLQAQINPNGLETTYELYLSSPACQANWPEIGPCMAIQGFSVPGGSITAGSGDQTVSLDLNSAGVKLQAGTWYEYSVSAKNSAGSVPAGRASEQDFKTLQGTAAAPSEVQAEPAEVIAGGAELKGELNPGGLPTTYYFEYLGNQENECLGAGLDNCWHHTESAGPISGDTQQQVSPVEVTGLRMGETYRYRLVADNDDGTSRSAVGTFTVGFAPVITSLEPDHGPTSGGTTVTLHGEPLENARAVYFGGVQGTILHEECDGECEIAPYRTLVVESPPHAAGTVDVTVQTAQGASIDSVGDEFTYGPSDEPSILSESVSDPSPTDATLQAQIDTEGLQTSYRFTLQPEPCSEHGVFYCELVAEPIPLPGGTLLGSFVDQSVSLDLNSVGVHLNPREEYSYSVIASSTAGSTQGRSQTFTAEWPSGGGSYGSYPPPPSPVVPIMVPVPHTAAQPAASGGPSAGGTGGKTDSEPRKDTVEKLTTALRACKRKPRKKQASCEKQARKNYALAVKQSKSK
jgi:IPT/TIG domain